LADHGHHPDLKEKLWPHSQTAGQYCYNLLNKGVAPPALSSAVYLRLFTADPTAAGSFTAEVTGGSYTGQNIVSAMGTPTNGVGTSTAIVTYAGMPAVTVSHWAKCRTAAGTTDPDEMIERGPLSAPVTLTAGQPFDVPISDLDSA
jgi:hypothetical protein